MAARDQPFQMENRLPVANSHPCGQEKEMQLGRPNEEADANRFPDCSRISSQPPLLMDRKGSPRWNLSEAHYSNIRLRVSIIEHPDGKLGCESPRLPTDPVLRVRHSRDREIEEKIEITLEDHSRRTSPPRYRSFPFSMAR